MKIVVWGCGIKGQRIFGILPKGTIVAYIDSKKEYLGKQYKGIKIISFEDYLKDYSDINILISAHKSQEIQTLLGKKGIHNFWILNEEPIQMYSLDRRCIQDVFKERYNANNKYFIKGSNVYSILLHEYLTNKGYSSIFVLDNNDKFSHRFIRTNYDSNFCYTNEINGIANPEDILVVCDKSETEIEKYYSIDMKIYLASDSLKNMYMQKYPELAAFKNIHKDQRCFIVANGPSLRFDDLDSIAKSNIVSFGVNGIYKSSNYTKWRPKYFVVGDASCANNWFDSLIEYQADEKFILDGAEYFWERILPSNIYKIFCSQDYGTQGIYVSDDITYGISKGMTVIHICLQIAMYMGFKDIYIIGADTTQYSDTKKSHFIDGYHDEKIFNIIANPFLDIQRMIMGYESIRAYANSHGINIYNATRGGALEVFERVNFDEVIGH